MDPKTGCNRLYLFRTCLKFETFPDDWNKRNILSLHKKDNKQIVNNYCPVFLYLYLQNFWKARFQSYFWSFDRKKLLSSTQSGLKPNDYCFNQFISVTNYIFTEFEANLSWEVREAFLDLSETFDKFGMKLFCIN